MSELRWILIAVGVALLLGIYLYSKRSANNAVDPGLRREPRLAGAPEESPLAEVDPLDAREVPEANVGPVVEAQPQSSAALYGQSDLPLSDPEPDEGVSKSDTGEKIVAIHVAARGGRRLRGADVVAALQQESLQFGEYEIFHRRTGNRAVFSVSSMVEPGRFDLDDIESYTTPGITLFMIMPGPESPVATFTEMLSTARRIATTLDAEVLDESGSTLSRQAASHMREQIIEFAHRVR